MGPSAGSLTLCAGGRAPSRSLPARLSGPVWLGRAPSRILPCGPSYGSKPHRAWTGAADAVEGPRGGPGRGPAAKRSRKKCSVGTFHLSRAAQELVSEAAGKGGPRNRRQAQAKCSNGTRQPLASNDRQERLARGGDRGSLVPIAATYSGRTLFTTMSPIWDVPIPLRASAEGTSPLRRSSAMAFSTRAAAAVLAQEVQHHLDRGDRGRVEATFFPAYLGAEPWMGSNMETWPGWMFPDAAIPMPPCSIAPRSVMMSPNMFVVTTTSNHSGFLIIHMQRHRRRRGPGHIRDSPLPPRRTPGSRCPADGWRWPCPRG